MPVTLTKIVGGQPVDTANGVTVRCPKCLQPYWLSYTDNEWRRVKDWLKLAETAIRKDHDLRHEARQFTWSGTGYGDGENGWQG